MKEKYDILQYIWKSHENYIATQQGDLKDFDWTDFMAKVFCPGPSYHYILNSPGNNFASVSPSIKDILGISPKEATIESLLELLHPDDLQFFLKCEDTVAHFLQNCIPPEKIVKYKISYCLREKTANHGYRLFLMQTITLKTTDEGALVSVFGSHTDISHITQVNNRKLSLIGLDGEPSFLEIDVFQDKVLDDFEPFDLSKYKREVAFTNRELEVIRLLAKGLTSEEIAIQLNISNRTVDTHRNNLMKKSKSKNTIEMVADCIRNGYI